jgi:UDP-N-acetylglucosamine--N-acetylmuramyl-(pentapeptide) pyrophosphoryl-undecaprenol N-acetylglucosamine transferase
MSEPSFNRLIALAAGGTGGHLFPAESLARVLKARGFRVELISDDRVAPFAATFPADAIHRITSGTVTGAGIGGKLKGALALGRGLLQARALIGRLKPAAVVGFGGYPSVPPVLAATMLRIPTVLHEQNAVMGRANRFLAGRVSRVATGFPIGGATVHVGNPVRAAVIEAAKADWPPLTPGGPLHLLVFGGSQGARVMGEIVPPAIALLTPSQRTRLSVVQQVREEDLARVQAAYEGMGVQAECNPFFRDLPARMAASHCVIARSGASTVAELSVIGRPSILVPLPGALDQDQAANARILADAGAAEIMRQPDAFTPEALAQRLAAFLDAPETLSRMAAAARAVGIADAAERLADLVLEVAGVGNGGMSR